VADCLSLVLYSQILTDPLLTVGLRRRRDESTTRGHQYKLYKSHSRLDIRKYSFTQRIAEIWNNLTSKVVTAPTTMSFESRLDKFWENQPRKYNYSQYIFIVFTG
jgi:hypothetical protein